MKIIRLNQDNMDYFKGLDPFCYLEKKHPIPVLYLGAAREGERTDIPVGLAMCGLFHEAVVLFWLYVEPAYRGNGYGDALLSKVFEIAENGGKRFVAALLGNEYGRALVCQGEREYLTYNMFYRGSGRTNGNVMVSLVSGDDEELFAEGIDVTDELYNRLNEMLEAEEKGEVFEFSDGKSVMDTRDIEGILREEEIAEHTLEGGDFTITCDKLAENERLVITDKEKALMSKENTRITGLADISLHMFSDAIKTCLKQHPYGSFEGSLKKLPVEWFEKDISSCAIKDAVVTGLLLVHKDEEGTIWGEYLFDTSKNRRNNSILMIKRSAAALLKRYPKETRVVIRRYNEETRKLVEVLFGKIAAI